MHGGLKSSSFEPRSLTADGAHAISTASNQNTSKPRLVPLLAGEANCQRCISLLHVSERSDLACFSQHKWRLVTRIASRFSRLCGLQATRRQIQCIGNHERCQWIIDSALVEGRIDERPLRTAAGSGAPGRWVAVAVHHCDIVYRRMASNSPDQAAAVRYPGVSSTIPIIRLALVERRFSLKARRSNTA